MVFKDDENGYFQGRTCVRIILIQNIKDGNYCDDDDGRDDAGGVDDDGGVEMAKSKMMTILMMTMAKMMLVVQMRSGRVARGSRWGVGGYDPMKPG